MFKAVMSAKPPKKLNAVPLLNVRVKVREALTVTPFSVTVASGAFPEPPQYRNAFRTVRLMGTPDSACVLVLDGFSVQGVPVFGELRSEPPVVTKLMLPVSRQKKSMSCAWAPFAPNSANSSNAKKHPRFFRPRMP
jgi:hypothetical protein